MTTYQHKLEKLCAEIEEVDTQLFDLRQNMASILEPMFTEQAVVLRRILKEKEFLSATAPFGSPNWNLVAPGRPTGDYGMSTVTQDFWQESQYNDGDSARPTSLLPAFVDGTEAEKEEAVREHIRQIIREREANDEVHRQKKIEDALATLKAAGYQPPAGKPQL